MSPTSLNQQQYRYGDMAVPHHRHQASLESIFRVSSSPPLEAAQRNQAHGRFQEILDHYEGTVPPNRQYKRPTLLRLTYHYASEGKSKDNVLRAFFDAIGLSIDENTSVDFSDKETEERISVKLIGFADFVIDNFFLPLKASTKRTPQPSPAYLSAIEQSRSSEPTFVGTTARLKTLRGDCLVRDRHRCVISRRFDQAVAVKRMQAKPDDARDDDHMLLVGEFDSLEVAHILPHSLIKPNADLILDKPRATALKILNLFDTNVTHLIKGPEIDRPHNAMTLTNKLHSFFGDFQIFFQPVEGSLNTYRIDTFLPHAALNNILPITRTLFVTDERTIEPPSPRLLAVHCAIAHILHLSAAGAHIDRILEDTAGSGVHADGSTALGSMVQLRLDGWLDGWWDGREG